MSDRNPAPADPGIGRSPLLTDGVVAALLATMGPNTPLDTMYRHLLVPIDSSDRSIELVSNAVCLARAVDARITFFHTHHHPAAGPQPEAPWRGQQAQGGEDGAGRTRELLAKAEAAARACGVPCDSMHAISDQPGPAILEASRVTGCDLVFMAVHDAHCPPAMASASGTLGDLMNAGLSVLVPSSDAPRAPAHAIGILRDEHRSMAAVLHAWMDRLSRARTPGVPPDTTLMQAMLRYLHDFPLAVHHPKEEAHLFSLLRERDPTLGPELDELQRQHRRDQALLAGLAQRLAALAEAGDGAARATALRELDEAVQAYAAFLWNHLGREEAVILPAAQRCLTADDWDYIDAAFARQRDPGFGTDIEQACRQLFARIVDADPGVH